jgi:maleylpyruvate isomerase
MNDDSSVPDVDLEWVADAQTRFLAAIEELDDNGVHRPSHCPGWTVGHILTHVARNADSHRRRAEAASRGVVVEQYSGGYAGRAIEIDQGARRPAVQLREDVRTTAGALEATWRALPEVAWAFPTRDVAGRERPLRSLPARRWQELEVHLVDLGIGPTHREWPGKFVVDRLPELRATLIERLPSGAPPPEPGVLDERDELAWLYGRLQRADLPKLSPWG